MNRDKVTELLKNYRSYKYAVSNGIAPHEPSDTLGMPMGLDYGPRAPKAFGERGNTIQSTMDYRQYKRSVEAVNGAVEDVLSDDEQKVIRYKYLERNTLTLYQIADRFHMTEDRAKYLHRKALKSLEKALMFVDVPEIINMDKHLEKVPV
jgi:DNA-directed RNA polymerase sigma subunit (sigma70/sigma32)